MFKQRFLSSTTYLHKHVGQIQVKTQYSGDVGTQREESYSLKNIGGKLKFNEILTVYWHNRW
jgi:hypothetical protein